MSFCRKCGKPLSEGALFCRYCGEPVQAKKSGAQVQIKESREEAKQNINSNMKDRKEKKGRKKSGIIIFILLMIVLLCGAGIYLLKSGGMDFVNQKMENYLGWNMEKDEPANEESEAEESAGETVYETKVEEAETGVPEEISETVMSTETETDEAAAETAADTGTGMPVTPFADLARRGSCSNVDDTVSKIDEMVLRTDNGSYSWLGNNYKIKSSENDIIYAVLDHRFFSTSKLMSGYPDKRFNAEFYYSNVDSSEEFNSEGPVYCRLYMDNKVYEYYYFDNQLIRRAEDGSSQDNIETNEFLQNLYRLGYEMKRDYKMWMTTFDSTVQKPESYSGGTDTSYSVKAYVVNCNEWISLRQSPSTTAYRIAEIPLGAVVTYLETAENGFYKVIYNGQTGYALASYLEFR